MKPAWLRGLTSKVGLPFVPGAAERDFFAGFRPNSLRSVTRGLAAPLQPARGGPHPGGDRHGQRQDRVLPVSGAGPLRPRPASWRGRHQGAGHLSDECAGHRPGAAYCGTGGERAGVRGAAVGLYVGGNTGNTGSNSEGMVMTPHAGHRDQTTLRKHPPDIPLTNYRCSTT